ncbi:cytochrome P450 [Emcibacter nanhaiensis]|uniref:Cytochrome P450 n=1 Tax=Emcibacter nanhaiensis TaxID=1505037 RepID=A0A501PS80_9PROT|nr:cytochrome P450 [Emcibacter nanhaiensis]TPD62581.1 cytochrome P450 [Emcibacter nanhaiensis]
MEFVIAPLRSVFSCIYNIFRNIFKAIYVWCYGLWNLLWLIKELLFGKGTLADKAASVGVQHAGMMFLRAFLPTIVLRKKLITAYENTGTAVVTAAEDVWEVVNQDEVFLTAYAPKMAVLTNGSNFFLGMQNTPRYTNNVSDLRLAANRDDIPRVITPTVSREAGQIVAGAGGELDLPQQLTLPVMAQLAEEYFGTTGLSKETLIQWTHAIFRYIFFDFSEEPAVKDPAAQAAKEMRDYLDQLIADRKAGPEKDDVLGRCLKLQAAGMPAMGDENIRDNFLGMLTAMVPTIPNAAAKILDVFLDKPEALAGARAAALADDDELLLKYIIEAFRFNPMNPVIFRIAARDYVVAEGTLRQRTIPKGTFVFAANLSAMFDPWAVSSPQKFDITRPPEDYILWGLGLHRCFGEYISHAALPAFFKPLLQQENLRRAPGAAGHIETGQGPFPWHFHIEWD